MNINYKPTGFGLGTDYKSRGFRSFWVSFEPGHGGRGKGLGSVLSSGGSVQLLSDGQSLVESTKGYLVEACSYQNALLGGS